MENAGAVTFREVALLADPATAPLAVQKRVAEVITHELAHQWFGNLVTMVWWDDLWLNEAFATWMAYKIVDDWRPSWRIWMDFEAGKGAALALDALVSAHPIRADVQQRRGGGRVVRRHHLREGRRRAAHDRGLPGRGSLPRRDPPLHAAAPRGERDRRRSVGRARRGVGAADPRAWPTAGSGRPDTRWSTLALRRRDGGARVDAEAAAVLRRSERGGAAGSGTTRWLVPVVLRFRDATGVKEQRGAAARGVGARDAGRPRARSRGASATPTRAASTGPTTTTRRWRACCRRWASCGPAERMALISDQWALVRADQAPIERVPGSGGQPARRGRPRRARRDRRAAVADRAPVPRRRGPRRASASSWPSCYGARAAKLGWNAGRPTEDDEVRLRRAVLLRALVRDWRATRTTVAEAEKRAAAPPARAPATLDPEPARHRRHGGRAQRRRGALRGSAGPRASGDGSGEQAPLPARAGARRGSRRWPPRAVELALSDDVPMQDFSSYVSVLLGNRATREAAFALIRDRWTEVARQGRLADDPATAGRSARRACPSAATTTRSAPSSKRTRSTAPSRRSPRPSSACRWTPPCAIASCRASAPGSARADAVTIFRARARC